MRVDNSARSGGLIWLFFDFLSQRGDSNEYTQHTIFNIKKEKYPYLSQICSYGFLFKGTQERVRNSHGKRAISVRATEVLLYYSLEAYMQLSYAIKSFPDAKKFNFVIVIIIY